MIVQIDVDRFALLLDEWATAQTYGEDRDTSDDAAFIDANSAVIAVLLDRLVAARAAAAEANR
jgi:hypothetical protein